jgi:uncharacterized protein
VIDRKPFRVLSLDGGGMRGIYTAQYLASLADSFCKKRGCKTLDIGAGFDLIVGTSTGAILGCALAANIPMSKVVEFYANRGAAIFERRVPTNLGMALLRDLKARSKALKRGETALRSALDECFGQETVGEVYKRRGIALGITAVDMSTHRSWVFKTPHLSGSNHRDDPFTLVELCLASSAAPIYRSLAQMPAHDGSSGSHVFADGGLWANNPVLIGMIDALKMSALGQSIEIYSIGTVPRPAGDDMSNEVVHRGLLEWRFGAEAASLAIDAQEFAYHNMARMLAKHLDRPCTIVRFPRESVPAKMMQYLDLDEVRQDALQQIVNLARNDVNMTNSRCNDPNDLEAGLISRLFTELNEQITDPRFIDASKETYK